MDDAKGEAGAHQEIVALRAEIGVLSRRLEETHALLATSHRDQVALLRRVLHGGATYLGDHTALTFLANGARMFVDTRDRLIGLQLMCFGTWEPRYMGIFQALVRPGGTVVDIGANLGWYTLLAAIGVGEAGRVVAVEPNPALARLLEQTVEANAFAGRVSVLRAAVGDAPGVLDLDADPAGPGGGVTRPTGSRPPFAGLARMQVPAMPLDALIAAGHAGDGQVDLVKMDIEGWEGMALRGMARVMDRSPGLRLFMEWSPMQDRTPAPRAEAAAMLSARGYRPFRIGAADRLLPETWEDALREVGIANLVMLPAGDPLAA